MIHSQCNTIGKYLLLCRASKSLRFQSFFTAPTPHTFFEFHNKNIELNTDIVNRIKVLFKIGDPVSAFQVIGL